MKLNIEKIKQKMKSKGWSQSEFARQLGVERQWVWWLLNGKGIHSMNTVDKVADTLGLKGRSLLK